MFLEPLGFSRREFQRIKPQVAEAIRLSSPLKAEIVSSIKANGDCPDSLSGFKKQDTMYPVTGNPNVDLFHYNGYQVGECWWGYRVTGQGLVYIAAKVNANRQVSFQCGIWSVNQENNRFMTNMRYLPSSCKNYVCNLLPLTNGCGW